MLHAPVTLPGDVARSLEERRRFGEIVFRFSDARSNGGDARRALEDDRAGAMAPAATRRARGEGIFVLCSDPGELSWPDVGAARVVPASRIGPSCRSRAASRLSGVLSMKAAILWPTPPSG